MFKSQMVEQTNERAKVLHIIKYRRCRELYRLQMEREHQKKLNYGEQEEGNMINATDKYKHHNTWEAMRRQCDRHRRDTSLNKLCGVGSIESVVSQSTCNTWFIHSLQVCTWLSLDIAICSLLMHNYFMLFCSKVYNCRISWTHWFIVHVSKCEVCKENFLNLV